MKKFLSIMACMVMILVGGVALASCGRDEFASAENISAQQMAEYLNSEEVVSEFNGYNMTMHMYNTKIFDASVANVDNKLQLAMYIDTPNIDGIEAMKLNMYLLNDVVYIDGGNANKYKVAYDPADEDLQQLQTALQFNGNLKGIIEESFVDVAVGNLTIKKLIEENTTKFLISSSQPTIYGTSNYSMKLVYNDNALVELSETVKLGKTVLSSASIKAFNGSVQFPENLESDTSYTTTM